MTSEKRERKKRKKDKSKRIFNSDRFLVMLWSATITIVVCTSATFAWYGARERLADSAPAKVMKPYYLNLRNPSDTANLQLSVGNLFPGDTKQIVFCVSNQNNEKSGLDMGVTSFEYAIELIHTENLALEYKIYELIRRVDGESGAIEVVDYVESNGTPIEVKSYFDLRTSETLTGDDVSLLRREQVGLTAPMPVNAGKYTAYTKTARKDDNDNFINLKLEAGMDENGDPTFDSQYFLLEIDWVEGADTRFENYEKETDMIYLVVEALQPKPEKETQ